MATVTPGRDCPSADSTRPVRVPVWEPWAQAAPATAAMASARPRLRRRKTISLSLVAGRGGLAARPRESKPRARGYSGFLFRDLGDDPKIDPTGWIQSYVSCVHMIELTGRIFT